MNHIDQACHFSFEFKRKYEIKLENLESELNKSFNSTSSEHLIKINQNDQSLHNMIPITEVDNDEMFKKTSRSHNSNNFENQLFSRKYLNGEMVSEDKLCESTQVVNQLLVLECAFTLEEQFNLLKEKIMFFYSFTDKFILNVQEVEE
jgi:hypothetical protein